MEVGVGRSQAWELQGDGRGGGMKGFMRVWIDDDVNSGI